MKIINILKIRKFYHLELISINILFHFFLQGFLCKYQFSSVQFSRSVMSDSLQPHGFLSIINSWSLLKLMSIESVMPSNHLILYCPLLFLPSIFPSIRVFSNELVLHIRWPMYWNFSFSISPSNKYTFKNKDIFLMHELFCRCCCSYPCC